MLYRDAFRNREMNKNYNPFQQERLILTIEVTMQYPQFHTQLYFQWVL